jgi:hypothetical protein
MADGSHRGSRHSLYESGSYLTLWLRFLLDSFRTRFRYPGDSGSGTCFTPLTA